MSAHPTSPTLASRKFDDLAHPPSRRDFLRQLGAGIMVCVVLGPSDLLGAEGYDVESATDGPTGLSRALKEKFDLLAVAVAANVNFLPFLPGPIPMRPSIPMRPARI